MKLVQVKTVSLVQVEEPYVKNLNAENTIQSIFFAFTNISSVGEERLKCFHCMKILAVDCMKLNTLKKHLEIVPAECVEKHLNFSI